MAKKYTIPQFTDRMEKLTKNLNKAILPPFRKDLKIMQRALFAEYWKSPFAARIWKWTTGTVGWTTSSRSGGSVFTRTKSGPSVKLGTRRRRSYARWSASQRAYIAKINIGGLAAMLEEGGRLRRHVFWGRKGDVRTPGLPVPRRPVYARVVENKLFGKMIDDVSKSFWKFVEREL